MVGDIVNQLKKVGEYIKNRQKGEHMNKIGLITFITFVAAILLTSLVESLHDKQFIDYSKYDFWMKVLSILREVSF